MIFSAAGDFWLLTHVDSLLGTPMEARKTSSAIIANDCFPIYNFDVVHGAHLCAEAAADTVFIGHNATEIIGIIHRRKGEYLQRGIVLHFLLENRLDGIFNVHVILPDSFPAAVSQQVIYYLLW